MLKWRQPLSALGGGGGVKQKRGDVLLWGAGGGGGVGGSQHGKCSRFFVFLTGRLGWGDALGPYPNEPLRKGSLIVGNAQIRPTRQRHINGHGTYKHMHAYMLLMLYIAVHRCAYKIMLMHKHVSCQFPPPQKFMSAVLVLDVKRPSQ